MHGHVRAIQPGELFGQRAEVAGLYAVAIYLAGYFDTAIGQIVNQAGVADVAIDDRFAVERDGFDDKRAIFIAALGGDRRARLGASRGCSRRSLVARRASC